MCLSARQEHAVSFSPFSRHLAKIMCICCNNGYVVYRSAGWEVFSPRGESPSGRGSACMALLRGSFPSFADKKVASMLQTAVAYSSRRMQAAQQMMAV